MLRQIYRITVTKFLLLFVVISSSGQIEIDNPYDFRKSENEAYGIFFKEISTKGDKSDLMLFVYENYRKFCSVVLEEYLSKEEYEIYSELNFQLEEDDFNRFSPVRIDHEHKSIVYNRSYIIKVGNIIQLNHLIAEENRSLYKDLYFTVFQYIYPLRRVDQLFFLYEEENKIPEISMQFFLYLFIELHELYHFAYDNNRMSMESEIAADAFAFEKSQSVLNSMIDELAIILDQDSYEFQLNTIQSLHDLLLSLMSSKSYLFQQSIEDINLRRNRLEEYAKNKVGKTGQKLNYSNKIGDTRNDILGIISTYDEINLIEKKVSKTSYDQLDKEIELALKLDQLLFENDFNAVYKLCEYYLNNALLGKNSEFTEYINLIAGHCALNLNLPVEKARSHFENSEQNEKLLNSDYYYSLFRYLENKEKISLTKQLDLHDSEIHNKVLSIKGEFERLQRTDSLVFYYSISKIFVKHNYDFTELSRWIEGYWDGDFAQDDFGKWHPNGEGTFIRIIPNGLVLYIGQISLGHMDGQGLFWFEKKIDKSEYIRFYLQSNFSDDNINDHTYIRLDTNHRQVGIAAKFDFGYIDGELYFFEGDQQYCMQCTNNKFFLHKFANCKITNQNYKYGSNLEYLRKNLKLDFSTNVQCLITEGNGILLDSEQYINYVLELANFASEEEILGFDFLDNQHFTKFLNKNPTVINHVPFYRDLKRIAGCLND